MLRYLDTQQCDINAGQVIGYQVIGFDSDGTFTKEIRTRL